MSTPTEHLPATTPTTPAQPTQTLTVPPAAPAKTSLLEHAKTALASAPNEVDAAGFRSFELEAGDVMSRARTQRAQKIVRAALAAVVLLIVWACLAHVDEITKGDDFLIDMGDGKGERMASTVLDDLDKGDAAAARFDLCGRGPA